LSKWYGWTGGVLRVDLTKNKVTKIELNKEHAKNLIGGRGINSKILFDETKQGIDALSPENLLIFGTGPLDGTLSPSSGRYTVTAKSPLTGILGDANSGGFWGPELKFAGYDHIVVKGRAKEPVYLWVDDDQVEVRRGTHLWGKDTWETDKAIKQETGDNSIQVACIGPAGEKLVRFACAVNNLSRAAGRTGMGAVMGSKNLKAIAVRGTKEISIARPKAFEKAAKEIREQIHSDPYYKMLRNLGSNLLVITLNRVGNLGYRNSQSGTWDEAMKVSGEALLEKYVVRHKSCFGCGIQCSRYYLVQDGEYKGTKGEGPEYNTIQAFGPSCGNADLASILYANNMCNKLGLDTISAGNAIAWAMECYQRKILTKEDTGGIELDWGDHNTINELIEKIGRREGFGDILAEGTLKAAMKLRKGKEYVIHSKGNPWTGSDQRSKKGGVLAYITSTRGADHLRGLPCAEEAITVLSPEVYQKLYGIEKIGDPTSTVGKAPLVIWNENLCAVADALEICKFSTAWFLVFRGARFKELSELFSAATGIDMNEKDMVKVGERIINVERAFNVREGISRKDEKVPKRFMEPSPSGRYEGHSTKPQELKVMLDEYYKLRGWEVATGIPNRKKLEEIGLRDEANELEKLNINV